MKYFLMWDLVEARQIIQTSPQEMGNPGFVLGELEAGTWLEAKQAFGAALTELQEEIAGLDVEGREHVMRRERWSGLGGMLFMTGPQGPQSVVIRKREDRGWQYGH